MSECTRFFEKFGVFEVAESLGAATSLAVSRDATAVAFRKNRRDASASLAGVEHLGARGQFVVVDLGSAETHSDSFCERFEFLFPSVIGHVPSSWSANKMGFGGHKAIQVKPKSFAELFFEKINSKKQFKLI
jgi:hypothetical protein